MFCSILCDMYPVFQCQSDFIVVLGTLYIILLASMIICIIASFFWLVYEGVFFDCVRCYVLFSSFLCLKTLALLMNSLNILQEEMDEKISELVSELDFAKRRCDVYRVNLLSVLKDIEDHKRELALKVQNVKLSLREGF